MSKMMRISLMNDFVFNLADEIQMKIEDFVGNDYGMDDEIILREFGLEEQFENYVMSHAA